jgi:hypothetical protein
MTSQPGSKNDEIDINREKAQTETNENIFKAFVIS